MISIVCFGGGVNSTAMLVGLVKLAQRPDLILFSDPGSEWPETYQFVHLLDEWLTERGFPEITWVKDENRTLEQECLAAHTLPSIVVGYRSCSDKYKIRPQSRYVAAWEPALAAWEKGEKVTKLVGFDAGEPWRAEKREDRRYELRFPLIEWGWGRERCIQEIVDAGLPVPHKSSCTFCPEMRESEILELKKKHPEQLERALAMERGNTSLVTIKGLARGHSWAQILDFHDRQIPLRLVQADRLPCTCFDGDE
jgi:hypothetical protein